VDVDVPAVGAVAQGAAAEAVARGRHQRPARVEALRRDRRAVGREVEAAVEIGVLAALGVEPEDAADVAVAAVVAAAVVAVEEAVLVAAAAVVAAHVGLEAGLVVVDRAGALDIEAVDVAVAVVVEAVRALGEPQAAVARSSVGGVELDHALTAPCEGAKEEQASPHGRSPRRPR
jgi:hypothetical protein